MKTHAKGSRSKLVRGLEYCWNLTRVGEEKEYGDEDRFW